MTFKRLFYWNSSRLAWFSAATEALAVFLVQLHGRLQAGDEAVFVGVEHGQDFAEAGQGDVHQLTVLPFPAGSGRYAEH